MRPATLILRIATRRDIAGVDALLARSYPRLLKPDYLPSVMVTAVPLIARARPGLVTSGRYYVAETENGRIFGAGGWSLRGGTADVRHLATDPDHTRQGIGARVVALILDEARRAGAVRLDCLATRTAVPFYEAMGFLATGPVEIGLGPGISFPAVAMWRPL